MMSQNHSLRLPLGLFLALGVLALLASQPALSDPITLHSGRGAGSAVVVGDSIYVIGGFELDVHGADVEKIDATTGQIQDVATTLRPRAWHTAQAEGPFVYVLGGQDLEDPKGGLMSAVERYDTRTSKVDQMAPLPTPRHLAASALSGGKLYVIGGSDSTGQETGMVEIYDIKANAWTQGKPMPTPRECALAVKDGVIYAVGGYDGHAAVSTVDAYDIATDTWRKLADLPVTLSAHHMALDGDNLYTFGDYKQLDRVGVYSLKTGTWRPLTNTGYAPSRHNAVVAVGGKVYVVGGIRPPETNPILDKAYTIGGLPPPVKDPFLDTVQVFSLAQLASL